MELPVMACRGARWVALAAALGALGCGDETNPVGAGATSTTASGSSAGGAGGMVTSTTTGVGGNGGNSTGVGGQGGAGGTQVPQNQFLYVANQSDDTVSVYAIGDDGALTFVEDEPVSGGPGPLAVTPNESRLYAASVSGETVSAFDIDPASGTLTSVGAAVPLTVRPVYIAVDDSAGYLLVASYGDNRAQSYALMANGVVNGTPISDLSGPGNNAHAIVLSPGNDHAFVTNTNPTPETISQYLFDASSGTLSGNTPATVDASGAVPVGPRHLVFHPTLDIVYVVNEHSDSVTAWSYAATTGLLTEGATTSTLPGGMPSAGNTCADIHITPDGKALYASNRGDDSLAMFSVDAAGALTVVGHVATEQRPREFEVTRDGRFVYAAGQDSDMLAAYRVEASGSLTPLSPATYAVGNQPMWVLAVSVDKP
jgi:6-phosphogluconolactonase